MGLLDRFFGPPGEARFARLVIRVLRQIGDRRRSTYDPASFRLLFHQDGEEAGMLNLRNLYEEYCRTDRRERAGMLRKTCVGLASVMETPEDFEDVRPDLMPTIRPRSMLEVTRLDAQLQGNDWKELAAAPLSDHLVICLVYDLPTTMQFLHQEQLDNWGVSLYEATEIARQNLEEREFSVAVLADKVYAFVTGDAFDASRMLLIDRIRTLKMEGEPVAMALNRESLMIAGADDPEGLSIMLELAEAKKDEPRPICPVLHRLSGDEWEPWRPDLDSPALAKLQELELQFFGGEYAEQKDLLDKLHAKQGDDIFVASFSGLQKDGQLLSYSVWSKDVPTWLPRTMFVAFFDPDNAQQPRFATWDQMQSVVGHLLEPLDCYPPRWFVEEFPSAEQLEAMRAEEWSK